MGGSITQTIRESYDRVADEYARRIYDELRDKPLDRELLDRFSAVIAGRGEVCDVGCGPGQVARYLRDAGTAVFGLDRSPGTLEQARRLNPDIFFREGNMMSLDLPNEAIAGITAFYAIVNIPEESLPLIFREMHRVYCDLAGYCCLPFMPATKFFMSVSCGGGLSQWISFFFSRARSGVIWRLQDFRLKRSLSGILILLMWSIRAEGLTSLPGNESRFEDYCVGDLLHILWSVYARVCIHAA